MAKPNRPYVIFIDDAAGVLIEDADGKTVYGQEGPESYSTSARTYEVLKALNSGAAPDSILRKGEKP